MHLWERVGEGVGMRVGVRLCKGRKRIFGGIKKGMQKGSARQATRGSGGKGRLR